MGARSAARDSGPRDLAARRAVASGLPSEQDFDAALDVICELGFDEWSMGQHPDGDRCWTPGPASKHQEPEAVYQAWVEVIVRQLQESLGPKSRSLAVKLVKVCGAVHASAMQQQVEEAEDPRAYVAATIKNGANGRCGNAEPRPPNFAVILKDIAAYGFDDWELSSKGRPQPTEDSECRTPEVVYRAWANATVRWAKYILGPEREHLVNELYCALGRHRAEGVLLEIRAEGESDSAAAAASIVRALKAED